MVARGKDPKYERWRWQIFGITWLAYAGFYLTRKSFSVAKNDLKKPGVMGLTTETMSVMDGAYSAAYAVGQFLWGTLGDRFGPRIIILFGMMASVVTALLMGASKVVVAIGSLYVLQGLWQSCGWAPLNKNMGEFFSRRERGSVMGFWCTNYALGGWLATILASVAAGKFGWRGAFFVPAAVLGVVWVLFLFFQRNRPQDVGLPSINEYHGEVSAAEPMVEAADEKDVNRWEIIREVLSARMVWFLAGVYFLVKPTRYLLLFWAPVYISERLGTDTASSGILGSMFDLAGPIGTLVGGIASDRVFNSRRMPVCAIACSCLALFMIVFPFVPVSRMNMGIGMFVIGFLVFIPDSLISSAAAIDFGTRRGTATANGFINGVGSIGQIFGSMLPGMVKAYLGAGRDFWTPIFVGLGISLIVAGGMLISQWNTVPKSARAG